MDFQKTVCSNRETLEICLVLLSSSYKNREAFPTQMTYDNVAADFTVLSGFAGIFAGLKYDVLDQKDYFDLSNWTCHQVKCYISKIFYHFITQMTV